MKAKNIIREVSYKGHIITVFEDGFHQEFVIIDNDESKLYDSTQMPQHQFTASYYMRIKRININRQGESPAQYRRI